MGSRKPTIDEIIYRSNITHNNKYGYDKSVYVSSKTKMIVTCHTHGEFLVNPNNHISSKSGCPKCKCATLSQLQPKSLEEFINDANDLHDNKYTYNNTIYTTSQTHIMITCRMHGDFRQRPDMHLQGNGCPICARISTKDKITLTKKEFVDRSSLIHNNKYDYSKSIYVSTQTHIIIGCDIHGEFIQQPSCHMGGQGCPKCAILRRSSKRKIKIEDFVEKSNNIHNNKYNYESIVSYKNTKSKVPIVCPTHGEFLQTMMDHLAGCGCPTCNSSKGELSVEQWLLDNNISYIREYKFDDCKYKRHLPFDFYLPVLNICIEYDGEFHYKPFKNALEYIKPFEDVIHRDGIKTQYCINNNIGLIRIPYTEFNNINTLLESEIASLTNRS